MFNFSNKSLEKPSPSDSEAASAYFKILRLIDENTEPSLESLTVCLTLLLKNDPLNGVEA